MKAFIYTSIALICFAGNSVLCRLALGEQQMDAASFTAIRLISGVLMLLLILSIKNRGNMKSGSGGWWPSLMLFIYAIAFSYAYHTLETGMGALILFASVQITMIFTGVIQGHRLRGFDWMGVFLALSGFVYLLFPGLDAPHPWGLVLMSLAGMAWGFYTLAGKGATSPLQATTFNFVRTIPMVAVLLVFTFTNIDITNKGVWLAALSGSVASGLGYTIWYMALKGLSAVQAAVVQLLVPVIAALGGVIFAGEEWSLRLIVASIFVLGGILMVVLVKNKS